MFSRSTIIETIDLLFSKINTHAHLDRFLIVHELEEIAPSSSGSLNIRSNMIIKFLCKCDDQILIQNVVSDIIEDEIREINTFNETNWYPEKDPFQKKHPKLYQILINDGFDIVENKLVYTKQAKVSATKSTFNINSEETNNSQVKFTQIDLYNFIDQKKNTIKKPTLFIGSSTDSLEVAYAIQQNLDYDVDCTVWNQGIFTLSSVTINQLIASLNKFDFGVFIFTPNDISLIRQSVHQTVRDNVVFEFGLFIGNLGINRTFFVMPRDQNDFHLPTDLLGVTPATYNANRGDGNLQAALGPACNEIRKAIQTIGPR